MKNFSQFNGDFINCYKGESDKGCSLEADVQYPKNQLNFVMVYYFYEKEWKLKKMKSCYVTNSHDKTEYVINIRNSKRALNHRLVLKKIHRVIL